MTIIVWFFYENAIASYVCSASKSQNCKLINKSYFATIASKLCDKMKITECNLHVAIHAYVTLSKV